ncbi:polysaccharide pyruvyl transferase CsaB [Ornithinibacillus scapharcae]|uniref:polysaccharide pyruvyl transferase CsaB n=1 Tax=Ornithinibacillus scapharcae TaxID=1147159 RepID=UPI000225BB56|nr:polysaccharide pyruvyl transferase CsaB [Ornithinibacillus scapharcae]
MHVVLSGYYGFDNVGDEAILFSIVQALREVQPDIEITVLSNNPDHTAKTYDVKAVNRWKFGEVSATIKASDGLISGGGSLLQDQTGMKSIPYYTGIMRIARWHKKPVFIYAQGMGPINRGISKWFVRSTLNKVSGITVRDVDSQKLLQGIGVKLPISIVPDPVLGLAGKSFTSVWEPHELGDQFVTVSVRDWPSEVKFKEKIAGGLDELVREGYGVVFVPMHGEHDAVASKETADLMKEKSFIYPSNASIEEKIAIIGESRLLIGMRLHALIFSAVTRTPFIGLSYDPKINSFAAICEQPIAGHVNENNWDSASLALQAKQSLDKLEQQEQLVSKHVEVLNENAIETARMAVDIFTKAAHR